MPSLAALESLAAPSPAPATATRESVQLTVPDADGPSKRMADVSQKFSQFYSDLEHEKQRRSEVELGRRNALFEQVQKLELDVHSEHRRRREREAEFKNKMEHDLRLSEKRIEKQLTDLSTDLTSSMDVLKKSIATLTQGLREERTQRRMDVEKLAELVVEKLGECQSGIDDERVQRLEREAVKLKRVGEDVLRISSKVDETQSLTEDMHAKMQSDIDSLQQKENETESSFQGMVLSEIATIKRTLNEEKSERVCEDERIVLAVNEYTKAMQDGLRLVNRG